MAIWCISSSPLMMGNDLRNVSAASRAILLNARAIAVSQDPLGQMGIRITGDTPQQVWAKNLTASHGATFKAAVGLYNKMGTGRSNFSDIEFEFADIPGFPKGMESKKVMTVDIWTGKSATVTTGKYIAKSVALHGTAFITFEV